MQKKRKTPKLGVFRLLLFCMMLICSIIKNMKRILKQFLYGSIFIVIILVVVWGVYAVFLKSAPTCFDKIQNQGETGVDCGGPCVSCEINHLEKIRVKSTNLFKSEDGIGVVVSIQNPNVNWGANNFNYNIKIKNGLGEIVDEINGKTFIYAGEFKYLIIPVTDVKSSDAVSVVFSISNITWKNKKDFKKPDLVILDTRITKDEGDYLKVSGKIENRDEQDYSSVYVSAILYSYSGNLLAASKTKINLIKKFNSTSFSIIFPKNLELYAVNVDLNSYFPKDLKFGDSGKEVKNLQIFLAELNILPRDPTGFYDDATRQGVVIIQKQFGLKETGEFDAGTRTRLIKVISSSTNNILKGQKEKTVDVNMTKIFVEALRD